MFNASTGWAQRQSDGAVLRTTVGVSRWKVASPSLGRDAIFAAAFVDADAARILTASESALQADGGDTTISSWATDNGGATWVREGSFVGIPILYSPPGSLDFVDREHGWYTVVGLAAMGSSALYIYRTTDGGSRWSEVEQTGFMATPRPFSLPLYCDKNQASFIDAETGWVTATCNGGSDLLYVTDDGGGTWRSQPLGVKASEYGYTTYPPQFVSRTVGFMVGFIGNAPAPVATLFVTTNSGTTWTARAAPTSFPDASFFLDPDDGWVSSTGDTQTTPPGGPGLWVTRDAGRTWSNLRPTMSVDGLNLDFVTQELGWACTSVPAASSPAIGFLQTTDGGHRWTAVNAVISA